MPLRTPTLIGKDIIIVPTGRYYGKEFIDQYPEIKVIASNTTGDGHIDVKYCTEKGIVVVTLKNDPILQNITAVAELTFGLIIALTRNMIPAYNSVKAGHWNRYAFGGEKMLKNSTLGIIGSNGRLGNMVWDRARGFGMECFSYDKSDFDHDPVDFSYVLGMSDIVTVHIPKEGNEGLFDRQAFAWFKDGAYFINTSRGEIVDEDALIDALHSGKLAGAAVDVLNGEFESDFDVRKNKLVQYAKQYGNLIITPHIGGSTEDAWKMTEERIMQKVS